MSKTQSETSVRVGLMCVILAATLSACSTAPTVGPTGEAATVGLAAVRGRVVDLDGVPLDSFRLVGSVPDSSGFYTVVTSITSTSGSYSLRLRRSAAARPDSVLVTVTATSTKSGDRTAEGISRSVRETVWLPFVAESDTVTNRSRDLIVPFRRR